VSLWGRALAAAAAGAVVAALCLTAVTSARPALSFGMHGPAPAIGRGFHAAERDGEITLAWTAGEAVLAPAGIDRSAPWQCTVRFRSGRPGDVPRAVLLISVDGAPVASAPAADGFDDLAFSVPASDRRGADIVLTSTPPFTPGGADTRELGVQIDRLACAPARGWAWPPPAALRDTALAAAFFAFVIAAAGGSIGAAILMAAAVSLGAAMMLTIGAGLYIPSYSGVLFRAALGVAGATGLLLLGLQVVRRVRLSGWARFAVSASAVALFLELIGLLHPAKPVIDAMFHAHRLEWVMSGRLLFTQPFVGGVEMPYAIGLYVFALPWTWASADHVALIRIVTATAEAAACLLLYPLVVRVWNDRRIGAIAVLAAQLAPLPYVILGNANLTNVFGQALALVTMVVAVALPVELRRRGPWLLLVSVLTWALCSHVSTATTLACTLAAFAALLFLSRDADLRRRAIGIAAGLAISSAASWLIYYRHFVGEFRAAFARMFSDAPAAGAAAAAAEGYMTTTGRVVNLLEQAVTSAGVPLLVLAAAGVVSLARRRGRDPLTFALVAWATVWLVFSISTVFARVDAEYVRYAAEFLGRINLATVPLAAILAARGAVLGWDDPPPPGGFAFRAATILLLGWAAAIAAHEWVKWFSR
jgi:hypothetical protein